MRTPAALCPILASLLLAAACARPESGAHGTTGSSPGSAAAPITSFSRKAVAPARGSAEIPDPAVIASVDPAALDELLAAAPKLSVTSTAPDGGTLLGSGSGVPEASARPEAGPPAPSAARTPRVEMGDPTLPPAMANPAIERAARAQLYWGLTQRCRDKDGQILPPDVIRLRFTIDSDGYIAAPSIVATAADPKYADAAHCMRRELSTATFRAPAAARGQTGEVKATVPSVD